MSPHQAKEAMAMGVHSFLREPLHFEELEFLLGKIQRRVSAGRTLIEFAPGNHFEINLGPRQLSENERRVRRILSAIPDAIMSVTATGNFSFASPRAVSLFGYNSENEMLFCLEVLWGSIRRLSRNP